VSNQEKQVVADCKKRFVTEIVVVGKLLGRGEGKSKKQAEQEAARHALTGLQRSEEGR